MADSARNTLSRSTRLELQEITKVYPGVVALRDVSLSVAAGEVLGLIGENGAGKSTLMKILGGITAPTSGHIKLGDRTTTDHLSVQQALDAGIAFVHQELSLFDNLDVTANVFMGREKRNRFGLIDNAAMATAVEPILERIGARFAPRTLVSELSLAQRQMLEIAKALSLDARIIIMDEPTSSLTMSETATLLSIVANLKADGISVIFISHRLSEVEQCTDRVMVLRDGAVVGELQRAEIDHDAMVHMMIGRELKSLYTAPARPPGDTVLGLESFRTQAHPNATIDLGVRGGEILGVAGLVGAGRTEMARAIFGIESARQGRILLEGKELKEHSPADAIAGGLYLVPEDRKEAGLIIELAICENITLPNVAAISRNGFVDRDLEIEVAEEQRARLSIKTPDVRRVAADMSGGNQQKVVLAKWLSMQPKVILFDEPTRGIDVGSKTEIYRLMRNLADEGVAIMMISSDMEEVIGVSDRIAVMYQGEISGVLERDAFSEHNILMLAIGKQPASD